MCRSTRAITNSPRPWSRVRTTAIALLIIAAAPAAFANSLFCNVARDDFGTGYNYCADSASTAGGYGVTGAPTITSPDSIALTSVTAGSGAGGPGASVLTTASAGPGALHGYVLATAMGPPPPDNYSFASSNGLVDARLYDSGTIVDKSGTLAVGTPVTLFAVQTVEGTFAGTGEARTDLLIFGQNDVTNLADRFAPYSSRTTSLAVKIGDTIGFFYTLTVEAGASNEPGAFTQSLADATDTALLNLDFLESGVSFVSASGFDYASAPVAPPSSNTSVPEPPTVALIFAALALVGLRRKWPGPKRDCAAVVTARCLL